jgi:hypothetical protein
LFTACLGDSSVTSRLGSSFRCGWIASGQVLFAAVLQETMTAEDGKAKIGGEYGEIRSQLDVPSLNRWLREVSTRVKAPVVVKQFTVSSMIPLYLLYPYENFQYGQVKVSSNQETAAHFSVV